jgi:hypothetical protein
MQYHYVVGYDTDMKKWFVELDTTAYFSEGNVWSDEKYEEDDQGFFVPDFGTPEYSIDQTLVNTLQYIVDTFPIPQEAS